VRGPILLVWDNAPIHQRKKVQDFIRHYNRLYVYNFPTCAPELNPVEFVWTQADEYLAGTAPETIGELRANVQAALQHTRVSQKRLWACLHASDLPWQRGRMRHYSDHNLTNTLFNHYQRGKHTSNDIVRCFCLYQRAH
jgi:hypothetical protein